LDLRDCGGAFAPDNCKCGGSSGPPPSLPCKPKPGGEIVYQGDECKNPKLDCCDDPDDTCQPTYPGSSKWICRQTHNNNPSKNCLSSESPCQNNSDCCNNQCVKNPYNPSDTWCAPPPPSPSTCINPNKTPLKECDTISRLCCKGYKCNNQNICVKSSTSHTTGGFVPSDSDDSDQVHVMHDDEVGSSKGPGPPSPPSPPGNKGLTTGEIVGISVGGGLGLIVFIAIIWYVMKNKKNI